MWRFALLSLTACWTRSAPLEVEAPTPSRCVIRDAAITPTDPVLLMAGGIHFATLDEELSRFDVTVDGRRGRAHLETKALELVADLRLPGFSLRRRTPALHDGWLDIRHAFVTTSRHESLDASVPLPEGIKPRVFVARLACHDVTFAPPVDEDDEDAADTWLAFEPGTRTAIAKTPGGTPLVHVEPTRGEAVRARVLERTGSFARVEIAESNTITGWIDTAHTREVPQEQLGGFGYGSSGYNRRHATCSHDVAIYVDTAARIHRVGRYKAGAEIYFAGDDAGTSVVHVDLGNGELAPHVARADLTDCTHHVAR